MQPPDYDHLRRLLHSVLNRIGERNDSKFDWTTMELLEKKGRRPNGLYRTVFE